MWKSDSEIGAKSKYKAQATSQPHPSPQKKTRIGYKAN